MNSNFSCLGKLKFNEKTLLSKVRKEKIQFKFIEHTVGFVYLTFIETTTWAAWKSNSIVQLNLFMPN